MHFSISALLYSKSVDESPTRYALFPGFTMSSTLHKVSFRSSHPDVIDV